jgi:hypothetical protein
MKQKEVSEDQSANLKTYNATHFPSKKINSNKNWFFVLPFFHAAYIHEIDQPRGLVVRVSDY